MSTSPATIRGAQFAASERIRLKIHLNARDATRHAKANGRGGFVAGLVGISYDPCSTSLTVRARGSAGSAAVLKLPRRQCPPA